MGKADEFTGVLPPTAKHPKPKSSYMTVSAQVSENHSGGEQTVDKNIRS